MKHKKLKLLAFLLAVGASVQAQQAIVVAGDTAVSSAGSVSYSIGQVFYTTDDSADGTVLKGIQMPYEIYVISTPGGETVNLSVFPNPAVDILNLQFADYTDEKWGYQLINMLGQPEQIESINSARTPIPMQGLAAGVYFLHVTKNGKSIKVFKIIKK
ncbi:hypothetical protein AGMMS49525_02470 [Bacteroidia bacterium]|nr:hypothetical protein AGMMS49525_02470 [Bacteroidia bacterium]